MSKKSKTSDKSRIAEENSPVENDPKSGKSKSAKKSPKTVVDIKKSEEYTELQDKYLRLAAEFENFKKRSAREFSRIIESAGNSLILEFLQVVDDMDRAMNHPQNDLANFQQGTEMIYSKFGEILQKQGLREIKAVGEVFDPNFHEAVMQLEVEDKDDGIIIEEVQKGYFLNSKVLRPSKVVVAKRKAEDSNDSPETQSD
ncbi:MAG: nucleotide exchange factor GrpE [candidate division Zixibacteria bacterium]|nr:nucleotide exchange factor GrpE [candidate division Zixibacteria bacterium]